MRSTLPWRGPPPFFLSARPVAGQARDTRRKRRTIDYKQSARLRLDGERDIGARFLRRRATLQAGHVWLQHHVPEALQRHVDDTRLPGPGRDDDQRAAIYDERRPLHVAAGRRHHGPHVVTPPEADDVGRGHVNRVERPPERSKARQAHVRVAPAGSFGHAEEQRAVVEPGLLP